MITFLSQLQNEENNDCTKFCTIQFSHSVMSNSLQPHGLQHGRLPCASIKTMHLKVFNNQPVSF